MDGFVQEAENLLARAGGMKTARVVLDNEQIKALADSRVAIVPPTETLDWAERPPVTLPIPLSMLAYRDVGNGSGEVRTPYDNVDGDAYRYFEYGNSFPASAIERAAFVDLVHFFPIPALVQAPALYAVSTSLSGNLVDNGLYYVFNNDGSGPLIDGDERNSLLLVVHYVTVAFA